MSCQTTLLWIEFKTLYVLRLSLDRTFSARLDLSSRTAAMPRFPDFTAASADAESRGTENVISRKVTSVTTSPINLRKVAIFEISVCAIVWSQTVPGDKCDMKI